ncbi:MAG: efflux RND transporter periplasmic adaptor subunit [Myxococcota bacterium]
MPRPALFKRAAMLSVAVIDLTTHECDSMRWFVLAALMVVATSCSVESVPSEAKASEHARPPARVRTAAVEARSLEDTWRFLGDVRADARASVAAGAEGTVTAVRARLGQPVARGDLMVEIDPDLAEARVAIARAQLAAAEEAFEQAQREVRRLKGLRKNIVPELDRERARSLARTRKADVASAQARRVEAEAQLARHRIRAPFAGVVAARIVDPGDWVSIGDRVLELVSSEGIDIVVDASRALIRHVKAGTEAAVIDGATTTTARVTGVVPALDPVSRTLRVRLVPNGEHAEKMLLPGASVQVEFKVALDPEDGQVSVPVDALLVGATQTRVVKVVDGKAEPVNVEVLAKARGTALVRSADLTASDVVVVRGNERLSPGQPVEVVQ